MTGQELRDAFASVEDKLDKHIEGIWERMTVRELLLEVLRRLNRIERAMPWEESK